jgi:hypothetical protein
MLVGVAAHPVEVPAMQHIPAVRTPGSIHACCHLRFGLLAVLVAASSIFAAPARASHDPNRTVTIYVHGFERADADRHGAFGLDVHEILADTLAGMAGLPVADTTGGPMSPHAVTATTYYGDVAPPYYTSADRSEIDRLTGTWGGGVPRYAFIIARYARWVLERSGADQVNFVSASFGSLVVRWLIEKDVAGLAAEGRIARWLTIEGLIGGNWAASRDDLVDYLDFLQPQPIDVDHMDYDWVAANLHSPRLEADSPLYGRILIGQVASSDDPTGALSALMLGYDDYLPNDGVQGIPDARFQSVTAASRFEGRPPTMALFHVDHLGIKQHAPAYAEVATFLAGQRRVTVTLASARVTNLHEPQDPWWNWTPAEVLFESAVYSPAVATRWGIDGPLTIHSKEGATAPLRRFHSSGETVTVNEIVFDDFVLPEETQLRVDVRGAEVDADPRYGVYETVSVPSYDDLGGVSVTIPTTHIGTYPVTTADWSGVLSVDVYDYAFAPPLSVPDGGGIPTAARLIATPNPSRANVRIVAAGASLSSTSSARLEITDVSGRILRIVDGTVRDGFEWDGRDAGGRMVPTGIYLYRLSTPEGVWRGRSCRMR